MALTYDPLGRLFSVTSPSTATQFLYDGDALVGEYVSGTMTRRYVHGPSAETDDSLLSYAGATLATPSYLHADHQGSIVAIGDPWGAGTINRYDEYGIPGAGNSGRFQYTGQIWIPELGMYYYKARVYSPTLGRFLQTDPVGYKDQVNLYAYVGNDPVNVVDPTGQFRVVYNGPEANQLRTVVEEAARADPELSRRYEVLQQSNHVHNVYAVQPIFPVPEAVTTGPNARENAQNGVGTGSRVVISLEPVALPGQGIGGVDITVSPEAQAAHELLSHAYDFDQGTAEPDLRLFGSPFDESKAIGIENRYRNAAGEPQRVTHRPDEPW